MCQSSSVALMLAPSNTPYLAGVKNAFPTPTNRCLMIPPATHVLSTPPQSPVQQNVRARLGSSGAGRRATVSCVQLVVLVGTVVIHVTGKWRETALGVRIK